MITLIQDIVFLNFKSIKLITLLHLVLFGSIVHSQTIDGRVLSKEEDEEVVDVHVLNLTTRRATITDKNGYFSITAKINDSLLFSAVQFRNKQLVVTEKIIKSKMLLVTLVSSLTILDEVVVQPYLLTGHINKDMESLEPGLVISASTLELPNANVKPLIKSERYLLAATSWFNAGKPSIDPIINFLSGRTKRLKRWVDKDGQIARLNRIKEFYPDSLFTYQLKIPKNKIDDFMYFCEADTKFTSLATMNNKLEMWKFLIRKSEVYRQKNNLE